MNKLNRVFRFGNMNSRLKKNSGLVLLLQMLTYCGIIEQLSDLIYLFSHRCAN